MLRSMDARLICCPPFAYPRTLPFAHAWWSFGPPADGSLARQEGRSTPTPIVDVTGAADVHRVRDAASRRSARADAEPDIAGPSLTRTEPRVPRGVARW